MPCRLGFCSSRHVGSLVMCYSNNLMPGNIIVLQDTTEMLSKFLSLFFSVLALTHVHVGVGVYVCVCVCVGLTDSFSHSEVQQQLVDFAETQLSQFDTGF